LQNECYLKSYQLFIQFSTKTQYRSYCDLLFIKKPYFKWHRMLNTFLCEVFCTFVYYYHYLSHQHVCDVTILLLNLSHRSLSLSCTRTHTHTRRQTLIHLVSGNLSQLFALFSTSALQCWLLCGKSLAPNFFYVSLEM